MLFNSEGTISVKQESNLLEGVCASCGRVIADRYVMRVNERNYHESCLSCAECATPLSLSCYARDCKFYCKQDYERIYATKCARCQQKIESSDLVMKVPIQSINNRPDSSIFHVECFVCCICNDPLLRGAHFILRQGLPLCKREFHNDIFNMNSPQGSYVVFFFLCDQYRSVVPCHDTARLLSYKLCPKMMCTLRATSCVTHILFIPRASCVHVARVFILVKPFMTNWGWRILYVSERELQW